MKIISLLVAVYEDNHYQVDDDNDENDDGED